MNDHLVDLDDISGLSGNHGDTLSLFRRALKAARQELRSRFEQGEEAGRLITLHASFIDNLLIQAWYLKVPDRENATLIAVGGYGRGELHPASDIDLLILLGEGNNDHLGECLSELLTFLWDIGMQVGHSVRTLQECVNEASRDVTITTNLLESRLLCGPAELHHELMARTGPKAIWPSDWFFRAKWEEQQARYQKYDDTISNLEPNIKESPGGLRDIHMVGWVVKRHYGARTLHDLVIEGFLSEEEYHDLTESQHFLWQIRFALHLLAGRHDDRILFDYQRTLAAQFGYQDDENGLGVEKFMQQYYRTALRISRMNEMLLQLFQEVILLKCHLDEPKPINRRFQSRSGFLETVGEEVFPKHPLALLELFLILEQHPELNGVRASTIRQVRKYRHLINSAFRADIGARSLFMEIMRLPQGITHAMRMMNRYGILARYIPQFSNIVGRMQYDLFHVYTVDEHTLFVLRNIRRFMIPDYRHEFPLCSDISEHLPKPELLFLGALFHDIAKGRGGDHSSLGAIDAWEFCKLHELSDYDSRLVSWLVQNHLLLSITAQRRDISDPDVVIEFAKAMENITRLDYLYLLTVADIRATDPAKWNSWKNALLRDLYTATKQALIRGLQNPQEQDEIIQNKQAGARHLLKADGFDPEAANAHWLTLSLDYFLYHNWEEIAWQTRMVLTADMDKLPLALLRKSPTRGGTEVFLYGPDQDHLFALTTSLLDQLGLNIVSARIETADTGYTLNSFLVLEEDGSPVEMKGRREEIRHTLEKGLTAPGGRESVVYRHIPRHLKHFSTTTRVDFAQDPANQRTIMKLACRDRPGLLSQVGYAFVENRIRLINAKISTIGAEVEDTFFITDRENRPLSRREQFEKLEKSLKERLD